MAALYPVFAFSRALSALCAITMPNARGSGMLATFTSSARTSAAVAATGLTAVLAGSGMVMLSPAAGTGAVAAGTNQCGGVPPDGDAPVWRSDGRYRGIFPSGMRAVGCRGLLGWRFADVKEIILIRHGATAGNLERRYIGRTDEPLCEQGRLQALWLQQQGLHGGCLAGQSRTSGQTNRAAGIPGNAYQVIPEWRETDFGIFEGKLPKRWKKIRTTGPGWIPGAGGRCRAESSWRSFRPAAAQDSGG